MLLGYLLSLVIFVLKSWVKKGKTTYLCFY